MTMNEWVDPHNGAEMPEPSLDLDRIKAAMGSTGIFSDGIPFKVGYFENQFSSESALAIAEALNAAPALITEIERLRGEVATAKKLGAAEELERMAKHDCYIVMPSDLPHVTKSNLEDRAAELRKEPA